MTETDHSAVDSLEDYAGDRPENNPKNSGDDPDYSEALRVNLTPDQKNRLIEISERLGVTQSDVVRELLENQTLPDSHKSVPDSVSDLRRELARIGNNLNQIARIANQFRTANRTKLLASLKHIKNQIDDLKNTVYGVIETEADVDFSKIVSEEPGQQSGDPTGEIE